MTKREATDLSTIQRTTRTVIFLMTGYHLTTAEYAIRLGVSRQGAEYILSLVELELDIYKDDHHRWHLRSLRTIQLPYQSRKTGQMS